MTQHPEPTHRQDGPPDKSLRHDQAESSAAAEGPMDIWQRLGDFARWRWNPDNMITRLRGSIALLVVGGLVGIGRGLYELEPAELGVGFLFVGMAAAFFFGSWDYWAPLIKRSRKMRRR